MPNRSNCRIDRRVIWKTWRFAMSSVQLLDKTRKIGKLLHNNNSSKVVFNDICKVMRDIVNSNVLVISKKGKVLGVGTCEGLRN